LPDGRHPDGRRGPAQKPWGWGLRQYKRELARLEAWKCLEKTKPEAMSEDEWVESWSDKDDGAKEAIHERFLDSRFASTPMITKEGRPSTQPDRPVTLITEFEDVGLYFSPTPGNDIEEGVELIIDALDYDTEKEVGYFNQPKLLISSECVNTIYSLATWTGMTREGRRCLDGATKDPIDNLRYFFLSDCGYLGGKVEDDEKEEEVRRYY
jgi:hypothetical protein